MFFESQNHGAVVSFLEASERDWREIEAKSTKTYAVL